MSATGTTLENPGVKSATGGIGVSKGRQVMNVLLATDGSSTAEMAIEQAINLARYSGGRLILTFYAYPNDQVIFHGLACPDSQEWRKYGREVLDKLVKKAENAGVPRVETVLEFYQDEECLTQLAQEVEANYIVLASHLFSFG